VNISLIVNINVLHIYNVHIILLSHSSVLLLHLLDSSQYKIALILVIAFILTLTGDATHLTRPHKTYTSNQTSETFIVMITQITPKLGAH
jgi:hypothetical protein